MKSEPRNIGNETASPGGGHGDAPAWFLGHGASQIEFSPGTKGCSCRSTSANASQELCSENNGGSEVSQHISIPRIENSAKSTLQSI